MVQLLGKDVGPTGYGLMGLTWRANPVEEQQAFDAMKAAIETGAIFWNGGEFYGDIEKGPNSLTLLNSYFTKYPEDRDKVILSIKGGVLPGFKHTGTPEGVRQSVDNVLRQLPPAIKKVDIFELARMVPELSTESQIEALEALRKEGKFGAIGLSEVKAETIRKAAAITKVASVEVEVSLWELTYLQNGVMEACAELGIPIVAYSPLGRGFLTGQINSRADFPEGDFRLFVPRFSEENFPKNIELVHKLKAWAANKGVSPAQLALAWVRSLNNKKGFPAVLPIPGATTRARVEENSKVVSLSDSETKELDEIVKSVDIVGTRYPEAAMSHLEG